jgi:parallel beta-helix repeat protein
MNNPPSVQKTTTATSNLGTTYTVTNTNDDGEGSLRWAITESNNNPGTDTILFNIEDGYYTITPLSALPEITSPVFIDGTSQPGYEGTPIIQISGYQAGEGLSGLVISAGDSTVRGLIITQFSSYGIRLIDQGNNIIIQGNYIGYYDYIFEGFLGNGEGGILIESANNLIGGATTSERNIISGNTGTGVLINNETAINNQVINNYIGLDSSGTSSRPNGVGVGIVNGSDNLIQENVIAGNTNTGVSVLSYGNIANNNQILSNWIGTNQDYNFLGNGDDGIDLAGAKNTLVQGNYIYYNQSTGVVLRGADTTGNQITNNYLFNNAEGMSIQEQAQGNSITVNTISYNNSNGISIDNSDKNTIQGNSIYENNGLGIDLGRDGVTTNDEGDSDTGANALQNYPIFTSAEVVGGTATLIGYLNSEANKEYRIEIFANRTQDASGNGEGEDYRTYITVTTDDNGHADFTLSLSNAERLYSYITGTATNPDGNTSEFSPSITLTGELPNLVITEATAPSSVGLGQSFTVNWTGKNDSSVTTGSSYWYDQVVFSKNNIYGDSDDIYLAQQYISSSNGLPLEPNETYTASSTVTLPGQAVGSGYLLLRTDAYNYQVESNENDNVYAQAIDIAVPNLIITEVTAPTTASASQSITVSWTGKNDSSVTTGSSYWYDEVVFSKNNIYGDSDDITVISYEYIHSGYGLPLEPNETYTVNTSVTLPSGAVGSGYLLFKTDAFNYQTESNENDNVYAQAIDIAVPNLIITEVTAPTTASASQSITVSWTGKNDSSVTTGSSYWYDEVVFSKNNIYGDSDDIYLAQQYISSSNGLPLEPNETYTASRTVTLPSSVVSNGYLLVRTDVYNNQIESNENDNVYAQAIDIAAPNLIISNVTAPTTASASQTITLSWTGKNDGSGTTVSNWYDRADRGTRRLKSIYHKLFMVLARKSSPHHISLINNNS